MNENLSIHSGMRQRRTDDEPASYFIEADGLTDKQMLSLLDHLVALLRKDEIPVEPKNREPAQ